MRKTVKFVSETAKDDSLLTNCVDPFSSTSGKRETILNATASPLGEEGVHYSDQR